MINSILFGYKASTLVALAGAINVRGLGSTLHVTKAHFLNNSAKGYSPQGGAVCASESARDMKLEEVVFDSNTANALAGMANGMLVAPRTHAARVLQVLE